MIAIEIEIGICIWNFDLILKWEIKIEFETRKMMLKSYVCVCVIIKLHDNLF